MPHRLKARLAKSWLVAACLAVGLIAPSGAAAKPSSGGCDNRANDTPGKLLPCIKTADLWSHMVAFQNIADQYPGLDGHPSRNSGEPGYLASALYVKDKMEAAGYDVRLQRYKFTYTSFVGTPTWSANGQDFALVTDWNPGTSNGDASGAIQPSGGIVMPPDPNGSTSTAGCTSADFDPATMTGKIALIQRGGCNFGVKVLNAKAAGAIGVVVYTIPGRAFINPALTDLTAAEIGSLIPFALVSEADGARLKATSGTISLKFDHDNYTSTFDSLQGTSMACPHATGVAALAWSVAPSLKNTEIATALENTAKDLGDAGVDNTYGFGLLDAKAAVDLLKTSTPAQPDKPTGRIPGRRGH